MSFSFVNSSPNVFARVGLVFLFYISGSAFVAAGELPDGIAIVEKHIEAIGGHEALEKHTNTLRKGEIRINLGAEAKPQVGPYELIIEGRQMKQIMGLGGIGKVSVGLSSGVAWSSDLISGAKILSGGESEKILRNAKFPPWADWQKDYVKVECVEVQELSTRKLAKVVLTPPAGHPIIYYFDLGSHLLVRTEEKMETILGESMTITIFGDWREVDGVKVAHAQEIEHAGFSTMISLSSVEFNVDLPEDTFVLPAEIVELLEMKNSQEENLGEGN